MDHHVEPQPSLPEGATAAVTEEATAASGQAEADADSEQVSLNGTHDDTSGSSPTTLPHCHLRSAPLTGARDPRPRTQIRTRTQRRARRSEAHASSEARRGLSGPGGPKGAAEPEAGADPISYSQDGAFSYDQAGSDDYQQEPSYTTDYPATQSGYNDGMNQSMHNDGLSPPVGGESQVPPYPAELRHGEPATVTTQPELAAVAALPPPRHPRHGPRSANGPRSARRHRAAARTWSSPGSSPGRS